MKLVAGGDFLHQEQERDHNVPEQNSLYHQPLPEETSGNQSSRWETSLSKMQANDAFPPSCSFEIAKAEGFFSLFPFFLKKYKTQGKSHTSAAPGKGELSHWMSEVASSQQGLENQYLSLKLSQVLRPLTKL